MQYSDKIFIRSHRFRTPSFMLSGTTWKFFVLCNGSEYKTAGHASLLVPWIWDTSHRPKEGLRKGVEVVGSDCVISHIPEMQSGRFLRNEVVPGFVSGRMHYRRTMVHLFILGTLIVDVLARAQHTQHVACIDPDTSTRPLMNPGTTLTNWSTNGDGWGSFK